MSASNRSIYAVISMNGRIASTTAKRPLLSASILRRRGVVGKQLTFDALTGKTQEDNLQPV